MGTEAVGMEGEASPDNPYEGEESPASTLASPENALEEAQTPENPLDDMGASAAVLEATSSAPTSRCSSPLASVRQAGHFRSNSFQRWKRQMHRAWRWGAAGGGVYGRNREQSLMATLNLEIMAKQKRLWYRTQSKVRDIKQHREPTLLFEQFFIVGLHSHANVEVIEHAFAKRKAWEFEAAKSDILDLRKLQYNGQIPTLEPQVLFKYPPVKRIAMRENDIPAFCFPEGVKARLVERTPSMSDLNELVFGQEHLARDDLSFIFCLKVSDNSTLYGVCLHVQEIVQRAPGILGAVSPVTTSSCKPSRFLVAAPRCYCILTRVPFFELHYEMLNSIISQERLDRITQYVSDMNLIEPVPQVSGQHGRVDENCDYPGRESFSSWMGFAIPIDSVAGLTSSSAVIMPESEAAAILFKPPGCNSPESASFSEVSDASHARELDKESRKSWQCLDDFTSENSGYCSDSFERVNGVFENGQASPEILRKMEIEAELDTILNDWNQEFVKIKYQCGESVRRWRVDVQEVSSLKDQIAQCRAEMATMATSLSLQQQELDRSRDELMACGAEKIHLESEKKILEKESQRLRDLLTQREIEAAADLGSASLKAVEDFKASIEHRLEVRNLIENARKEFLAVEAAELKKQYLEEGFTRGFLKGMRLVNRKTGVDVDGISMSEASQDESFGSSGGYCGDSSDDVSSEEIDIVSL